MRVLVFVALLISCNFAWSVIETYEFSNDRQKQQFQSLVEELRCPKCQNQNLADSNSEIAADLRAEVYRLIIEGQSDAEITDYLVARFGEFVRYKPEVNRYTAWLWFAPLVMLAIGLIAALLFARASRSNQTGVAPTETLSDGERERLTKLTEED